MGGDMTTAEHAHGHAKHKPSLTPYFVVFLLLMVLTGLTVWTSFFNLGAGNTPLALVIAVTKATLVILFFMHAIHSPPLTWVVIIGSVCVLGILLTLTLTDYLTRSWNILG